MDDPVLGLEINILSARYLPKVKGDTSGEIIDPFVEIELHGIQKDS